MKISAKFMDAMDKAAITLIIIQIVVAIVCLILSLSMSFYISRAIGKPLFFKKNVLHMMRVEGIADFSDEEFAKTQD